MRTSRCTPDSVFAQPCALWPLISNVPDLMPGFFARRLFDDLDLEFLPLGPADIHAQQHARPIAALGAAGAGMDLDIGVVLIDLAGEQRLDLPALRLIPEASQLTDALGLGLGVGFRLAELDERDRILELGLETRERSKPFFELGALAHDFLRRLGIVPKVRIFGFGVEFREPARGGIDVKDASSAIPWTA